MRAAPEMPTRRQFCVYCAGAGAAAALAVPAFAQTPASPPLEELMKAGPLGEESQGKADAPITMIEYASMTCTHCARFATTVYPALKTKYIDTGKVRYILREFPLDPLAAAGSMLARCAGDDKYFAVVEALFQTQPKWAFVKEPLPALLAIARQLGFSEQSFNECLANQKVLDAIEWVRKRASEDFHVRSTPTFFINGNIHVGEISLDELDNLLLPYLKS
jgi:protein-disulfide isomerase